MANSNIFVVYTSASGNNVTLSPRQTSSYAPPTPNSNAQVTLLEGSGVSNGVMTANVKCKSQYQNMLMSTQSVLFANSRYRLKLQQLVRRYHGLQVLKRQLDLRLPELWRTQEHRRHFGPDRPAFRPQRLQLGLCSSQGRIQRQPPHRHHINWHHVRLWQHEHQLWQH